MWALAAVLAAAWLAWQPPVADLVAQRFRAHLVDLEGPAVVWNGWWYAGHPLPGYSILFPLLGWALGPSLAGALSAVGFAAAAERAAHAVFAPAAARVAALWAALGSATLLLTGRLTFALGAALATAAVAAAARHRPRTAVVLAAAASLGSPVAGAFLAMGALAWLLTGGGRSAVALGVAAVAPAGLVALAFPETGTFPFTFWAAAPAIAGAVLLLAVLPRERRTLYAAAALYLVVLVGAAAVPSALGGNAARLGSLVAGPVVAGALWPHRRALVLALAAPLLWWQWGSAVDDVVRASGDPLAEASTYAPLVRAIEARDGRLAAYRVEVAFTDDHAEALHLARHVPLARGWLRQADRAHNDLFYDDRPIGAAEYRRWLDAHAVAFVVLPLGAIDYAGAREADLIRSGPGYLREVWRDAHWRLFAVRDPAPAATGAVRATELGVDHVGLRALRRGDALVRVRWSPYWRLAGVPGCVADAGGWTRVRVDRPGPARLVMAWSPGRVRATSPRCG